MKQNFGQSLIETLTSKKGIEGKMGRDSGKNDINSITPNLLFDPDIEAVFNSSRINSSISEIPYDLFF